MSIGRSPSAASRTSTVAVALSLAAAGLISIVFLAQRNIYDDELGSFELITLPLRQLWQHANSTDVHPPGMYALSRLAWLASGSERWTTLFPLCVMYAGITFYVLSCLHSLRKISRSSQVVFIVGAYLHPQVLLWSNSVRWYPYWTGVALAVVGLLVGSRASDENLQLPSRKRAILMGALVGAMAYVAYLTIPFAVVLSLALLSGFGVSRRPLARVGMLLATALLSSAFQVVPFLTVHLAHSRGQRGSMLAALARLLHGVLWSEAFLPTHWLALIAAATVCLLLLHVPLAHRARRIGGRVSPAFLRIHTTLLIGMFSVAVSTGIGIKARSFLLVTPLLACIVAIGWELARRELRVCAAFALTAWLLVGVEHLVSRHGIAKSSLNDRPEQVVDYVNRLRVNQSAVVFTHDPMVAYELDRVAAESGALIQTVSTYTDYLYSIAQRSECVGSCLCHLFIVRSYIGSLRPVERDLRAMETMIEQNLVIDPPARLSRDDDVSAKRRFRSISADAADLPEYRYVIEHGIASCSATWLRQTVASWRGLANQLAR